MSSLDTLFPAMVFDLVLLVELPSRSMLDEPVPGPALVLGRSAAGAANTAAAGGLF